MQLVRWSMRAVASSSGAEAGGVVVLVLVFLALGSLVLGPSLTLVQTGNSSVRLYEDMTREYYAAEAGVQQGLWTLVYHPPALPYAFQLSNVNREAVDASIDSAAGSQYKIVSTAGDTTLEVYVAYFVEGFSIVAPGHYDVPADLNDPDGIYAGGDITLSNGAEIEGDVGKVYAEGDIILGSGTEIEEETGDLCVRAGGDIVLQTSSEIEGEGSICVCVGGDLTLGDNAKIKPEGGGGPVNVYVSGDLILGDGARIEGDVYVGGAVTLGNNADITGSINPYQPCPCCSPPASLGMDVVGWQVQ